MYGGPCEAYDPCGLGIQTCDEQNPQLPTTVPALWYVVAAWSESKHWCGVEFGFGDYANADNVIFVESNSCPPSALAIPTSGWPGPNEGIALAAYDVDWDGTFRPVYWFATYAYYELPSVIQLTANPATGFGGFANCAIPPASYAAVAFGALGIFADGVPVCPPEPVPHVCCAWDQCFLVMNEEECHELGGVWHPEWDICEPNPCFLTPTGAHSWGTIKSLYR